MTDTNPFPGAIIALSEFEKAPPAPSIPPPALAPLDPDCRAAKAGPLILDALDDCCAETIAELDLLIREIDALKTHIIEATADMKQKAAQHFDFNAEAIGFRDRVRDRLQHIRTLNGGGL